MRIVGGLEGVGEGSCGLETPPPFEIGRFAEGAIVLLPGFAVGAVVLAGAAGLAAGAGRGGGKVLVFAALAGMVKHKSTATNNTDKRIVWVLKKNALFMVSSLSH